MYLSNKYNCAEEIDVLIFVSQSPDYILPASSILLQNRLGLKKDCIAFDISLGCSGYVYGLSVISNLMQSGQLKKGLLIVGDKSSTSTTYTDKSTYPLFGDAGTATLIEHSQNKNEMHFNLQSDGSGKNAIIIEHGSCRTPFDKTLEDLVERKYIRKLPIDPMTENDATWVFIAPEPPLVGDIYDIHSGALGTAKDGSKYADW